jgi:hypothetical protein
MGLIETIRRAAGLGRVEREPAPVLELPFELEQAEPAPSEVEVHTVEEYPPELRHAGSEAKAIYRRAMANGGGQRFAVMCALQTPPGTKGTDRTFFEGKYAGGDLDKLPEKPAKRLLSDAKKAGISTTGKTYISGLADKRGGGDPEAWVSDSHDVLRVAKKRKLELKGAINYTPPEPAGPPKRVDINPKLVKQLAAGEMQKNPGLTRKKAEEIVRAKHTLKRTL